MPGRDWIRLASITPQVTPFQAVHVRQTFGYSDPDDPGFPDRLYPGDRQDQGRFGEQGCLEDFIEGSWRVAHSLELPRARRDPQDDGAPGGVRHPYQGSSQPFQGHILRIPMQVRAHTLGQEGEKV